MGHRSTRHGDQLGVVFGLQTVHGGVGGVFEFHDHGVALVAGGHAKDLLGGAPALFDQQVADGATLRIAIDLALTLTFGNGAVFSGGGHLPLLALFTPFAAFATHTDILPRTNTGDGTRVRLAIDLALTLTFGNGAIFSGGGHLPLLALFSSTTSFGARAYTFPRTNTGNGTRVRIAIDLALTLTFGNGAIFSGGGHLPLLALFSSTTSFGARAYTFPRTNTGNGTRVRIAIDLALTLTFGNGAVFSGGGHLPLLALFSPTTRFGTRTYTFPRTNAQGFGFFFFDG